MIGSLEDTGAGLRCARTLVDEHFEAMIQLTGRAVELQELVRLVAEGRLVTLTGVGGIGKTRLGMETARHMLSRFADGVRLAQLGSLSAPELVPPTVATAFGVSRSAGSMTEDHLAAALRGKQMLLMLDGCDSVIDAAARVIEALLRVTSSVSVIVTSRGALHASDEIVYEVPPLPIPAENGLSREALLQAGAVQLFIAHARDAEPQFSADKRMALIGRICRQLYGIPLAIQLAAPRTSVFGVEGLAGRLSEHFQRITGEDGNTLVLGDTVRATLDWSYELLPATERAVLRRLSLFRAGFTLGSATAIVAGGDVADADVLDYVTNLVAKSLIASYSVRGVMAYGLLDTIRAYAAQKLHESGELQEFSRRYAEYHSVCGDVRVPTAEQAEFTRFTTRFVNP